MFVLYYLSHPFCYSLLDNSRIETLLVKKVKFPFLRNNYFSEQCPLPTFPIEDPALGAGLEPWLKLRDSLN